jgi:ribonuclease G
LPDWLIERGIGETRAVRLDAGEIVEARIQLEGAVAAGTILHARMTDIGTGGRNAVARDGNGHEYLLSVVPRGVTQGAQISVEVMREAIPGTEPWKRPLARITDETPRPATELGGEVLPFPSPDDRLEQAGWSDLLEDARSGIVRFPGGELRVSLTPAMTLIDVDGHLPPAKLAMAGAEAAARTILRHGIAGSIGIDLPTISGKAERQAIGAAVDAILPQPFERTAVNGFGFLQIVRARARASLFELAADRAAFEARALLRRAALERQGATALAAHPAVIRVLEQRPTWIEQLSRQVGGAVTLRSDASLPIHGAYAQGE